MLILCTKSYIHTGPTPWNSFANAKHGASLVPTYLVLKNDKCMNEWMNERNTVWLKLIFHFLPVMILTACTHAHTCRHTHARRRLHTCALKRTHWHTDTHTSGAHTHTELVRHKISTINRPCLCVWLMLRLQQKRQQWKGQAINVCNDSEGFKSQEHEWYFKRNSFKPCSKNPWF